VRLKAGSPLALLAQRFVALGIDQGARLLSLFGGLAAHAQVRVDAGQLIVSGLKLRVQRLDTLKRQPRRLPVIPGGINFS
jgi:hypothetical protein